MTLAVMCKGLLQRRALLKPSTVRDFGAAFVESVHARVDMQARPTVDGGNLAPP